MDMLNDMGVLWYLIPAAETIVFQLVVIILIIVIGRKLTRMLCRLTEKGLAKVDIDSGVKKFLISIIRAACYILIGFVIADRLGIGTASLVAVLGSAGIAIGLALQGSLTNLAGGILLLLMKPFVVGDYIAFSGGEGTVKSIDIIYTTIVTNDNKVITVPNGSLSNGVITNMTKQV